MLRWTPVIWSDRDWDWCHLARVMQFKLHAAARLEETRGHLTSKRDAKQMRVCAALLRRLMDDEYYENAARRHGEGRLAVLAAVEAQREDQRLLGTLIGKHLTSWWD